MSYRFADSLQACSGWNTLILIAKCQQTCMTYTIAVCTVKNSWWWTEEQSEKCRVSFQNKFEKLVHLVGFIIRRWVVKFMNRPLYPREGTLVPTELKAAGDPELVWTFCRRKVPLVLVRNPNAHCQKIIIEHYYSGSKSKVKCTLVQELRLCTGRTAHRGRRGKALTFHDHGTRRGWGGNVTPRPLFTPGKDPVPIVKDGWAPGPVWTGA